MKNALLSEGPTRTFQPQYTGRVLTRSLCVGLCLAAIWVGSASLSRAHDSGLQQWRERALAGDVRAQYHLGRVYADGEGVRQSDKQAALWYRRAAGQGHALAQNKLGMMYQRGCGVPQDIIEAYKWFTLAAGSNANIYAVVNRDALARRMTLEELLAGQFRAAPMVAAQPAPGR